MSTTHIEDVRAELLATLRDLRSRDKPMEIDRARAVAKVASVLVESAKVEVDYLRATKQESAPFLEAPPDVPRVTATGEGGPIMSGMQPSTVHRLRG